MHPIIRKDVADVAARLAQLKLSLPGLIEVLDMVFTECGICNENDPAGTKGWTVYRWGVRGLRQVFRSDGWELDRTGNLETLVNHALKIRVAVLNTDDGTCHPDPKRLPRNTSDKGPNSERAALANADMLPGAEEWPEIGPDGKPVVTPEYETWHLCTYVRDDELRAELSLLTKFSAGHFCGAKERLFLVKPGEWKPIGRRDIGGDGSDVINFEVHRKK